MKIIVRILYIYMQTMWQRLYKGGSSCSLQGGTLQQLRNLINRRNVSASTSVKSHANEIEDFLELITRCHISAVVMHHFRMNSRDDEPHSSTFPLSTVSLPADQKWKILLSRLYDIIDRYIVPSKFMLDKASAAESSSVSQEATKNPHAQRLHNEHDYTQSSNTAQVASHLPPCITQTAQRSVAPESVKRIAVDGVFNYASAVLNDGLLLLEFKDAIREGDGPRILRCWKVMLIYFQYARHSNYVKEAIFLQAAVNATATPHVAGQMTWSRTVNTKGGQGRNIPVDLHNEHLNRALKTAVSAVGANIAPETIIQCGKSIKGIMDTIDSFDKEHCISQSSAMSVHTRSSLQKDEDAVLEELVTKSHVFDYIPGRVHNTFPKIESNPSLNIDTKKLFDTIHRYKCDLQRKSNVAKLYKHKF